MVRREVVEVGWTRGGRGGGGGGGGRGGGSLLLADAVVGPQASPHIQPKTVRVRRKQSLDKRANTREGRRAGGRVSGGATNQNTFSLED